MPEHFAGQRAWRIAALAFGVIAAGFGMVTPTAASAHATGQSFIALLPTGPYMAIGVATVALSIMLLWFLPPRTAAALLPSRGAGRIAAPVAARSLCSLAVFLLLCGGIGAGFGGTRDPLENPLVLGFWVTFWMASPMMQGYLFDLWGWISPWRWAVQPMTETDPPAAAASATTRRHLAGGDAPALLPPSPCRPGPDDPARLAKVMAGYAVVTLPAWRWRAAQMAASGGIPVDPDGPFRQAVPAGGAGGGCARPGWQLATGAAALPGTSIFILALLGTGSFDGFNETFVWLDLIGVNPLAFPGRSAVVIPVIGGLLCANVLLICLFAMMIKAGDRMVGGGHRTGPLLALFAPTILPIALAYHTAHYLPSLLVDGQYVLVAMNDPFGSGADLLGLADFYVTTGFFNHRETMRFIWLSQAAFIVFGHVIAVVLAHGAAVKLYGDVARAFRAGLPLAVFMVLYTWLGLWLLAAPKGG